MPKPFIVGFGPWIPDGSQVAFTIPAQYSQTTVPLANVQNVFYANGAYRTLPSMASAGAALVGTAINAFTAIDSSGRPQIFAGNGSDLYQKNGNLWTVVSKTLGAYSGATHWSFAEFAGCVLAADGIHALQDAAIGSNFADVSAAPIGNVIGVINQSFFVGDIQGSPNYPYRVQWSAIGDPTTWPTPLTDAAIAAQSGYEDLEQDFGPVKFISKGPQMGVILQKNGITRATYVGGDVVFQFLPYEMKRGCIARTAAVQVGAVVHFIADDGFHMTDGSQVVPTGSGQSAGLDRWFWDHVNTAALDTIRGGYDADKKSVVWAIPTGTNTLPDTLLIHNPPSGQWTKAALPTQIVWPDNDGTRHRLGVFDQTQTPGYLTGSGLTGFCETYDLSFVDGLTHSVTEAMPQVLCTDTPTMRVGVRQSLDAPMIFTRDIAREPFSNRVPFDPPMAGLVVRGRLTSSAATAYTGATLYFEDGSPI